MAAFPNLVLTNAGIALQNKVQGGAVLELTNIQMGSGQLNGQPIGQLTALISSNATVPIQGGQAIGQNTYQVEGFFTNADLSAGFWWREIGIFANDPDKGEILYAYANAGDAGDYIPTVTDQRIEKYIYFSMALANATTVNVTIPQTDTFVLKTEVGQPNGVAGLGENGAVPVAQGGTGATTAQGVVDAFGIFLAISAAAAYDPEGSYAVGDYCTHGGGLRKCSTAIPTGETWTEAHWTTTTVAAELAELSSQLSNCTKLYHHNNSMSILDLSLPDGLHKCNDWEDGPAGPLDTQGNCLVITYLHYADLGQYWGRRIYFPANDGNAIYVNNCSIGVWQGWERIPTDVPPQEFDLPLAEGWSGTAKYFKTQENICVLSLSVTKNDAFEINDLISTLPADCAPAYSMSRPASAFAPHSACTVLLAEDGSIRLEDVTTLTTQRVLYANIVFLSKELTS